MTFVQCTEEDQSSFLGERPRVTHDISALDLSPCGWSKINTSEQSFFLFFLKCPCTHVQSIKELLRPVISVNTDRRPGRKMSLSYSPNTNNPRKSESAVLFICLSRLSSSSSSLAVLSSFLLRLQERMDTRFDQVLVSSHRRFMRFTGTYV